MKKVFAVVLMLFALVISSQKVKATNYRLDNFSVQEGLAHKTVSDVYRDSQGFLWVGTTNGLSRFDGYSFKNYLFDENDPFALHAYIISEIQEDSVGNLWLATNNGVKYYNPTTESFHTVVLPAQVKSLFISGIAIDEKGDVWACNNINDIVRIHNENGTWTAVIPEYVKNNHYSNFAGIISSNNSILVISHECILEVDIENEIITCVDSVSAYPYCSQFKEGGKNEIITVFLYEGVHLLNTKTNQAKWIEIRDLFADDDADTYIYSATRFSESEFLLVTSKGFFVYDERISTIHSPFDQTINNRIIKDFVSSTVYDEQGIVWVGTLNLGLFAVKPSRNLFKEAVSADKNPPFVKSFKVLNDKRIIYSDNDGLHISNSVADVNKKIQTTISSKNVTHISRINNDNYIVVVEGTLCIYSLETKRLSVVENTSSVHCAYFDSVLNVIWYGSWGGGLSGIDLITNDRYSISLNSSSANNNSIFSMTGDSSGTLYLGMYSSGFITVENPLTAKRKISFYTQSSSADSLSYNSILSVYTNDDTLVWIGTCGGGLNSFDKKQKKFHRYEMVKERVIESIQADDAGNIWYSSDVLTKFNVADNTMVSFGKSDGVEGGFYVGASAKHNSGELYFGGINGIVSFMPVHVAEGGAPDMPFVVGFKLFGMDLSPKDSVYGRSVYEKSLTFSDSLVLPYYCNSIAFEFATLQYLETDNINYAYMLKGVDKDWVLSVKENRLASYAGLQPGSYVFMVKSSFSNNKWSEARVIHVLITPPWWATWWFKIVVMVFLMLLVVLYVANKIKQIKQRNKDLTKLVFQRTEELEEANCELYEINEKLKKQKLWLQNQNETLKDKQLVIEMKNEELLESLSIKDKLISVIGHDFKNPLFALQSYVTILKQKRPVENEGEKSIVKTIYTLTKNLTDQMLLILDWAKGNSGDIEFKPVEINIESLLLDAIQLVSHYAESKKINIETQISVVHNVFVDVRMINTVFRNILSNAIKYTPQGGSILIVVHEDDALMEISFIDTGVGMNSDKVSNVLNHFDVKYISYGTNNEKGSGLGLQICKNFIEINNGAISIESTEGKGSVFTVSLPKAQSVASKVVNHVPDFFGKGDVLGEEDDKEYSILIVEDNKEIALLLEEIFSVKYEVFKAFDGIAGLQIAQNMIPDVIVSDINIPKMSGIEMCRSLKHDSKTSHIPIFMITAEKDGNLEKLSYESGANDFIEKPFEPEILRNKVNAVLLSRSHFKEHLMSEGTPASMFDLPVSVDDELIDKILNMIKEECSDANFGVDVIASKVGMSRTQLWRKLKSTVNKTPGDIIRDMRLAKAVEMLKTGKYRVSEIAYSVGFTDPKYFSKTFSKKFGVSPSEYKG